MIKLDDFADYIESEYINKAGGDCKLFIGKLYGGGSNADNVNAVALYTGEIEKHTAVSEKSYDNYRLKILVHGSKDYVKSETLSNDIYSLFDDVIAEINGKRCILNTEYSTPVSIGTDDYGIFEFVINVNVIYTEVE
jgi:hypothetical protein